MSAGVPRYGRYAALALAGAVLLSGAAAASPAWGASQTSVVQGRILRLVSTADWAAASNVLPGQSVRWDVAISAAAPDPGTITLGVSAAGDPAVRVDARLCTQEWQGEVCPSVAKVLRNGWTPPATGAVTALATVPSSATAHLRLDVSLNPAAGGRGSTELRVHADGVGDAVQVGPGLPATGGSFAPSLLVLGAGLLLGGVIILIAGFRRRRTREPEELSGEERR